MVGVVGHFGFGPGMVWVTIRAHAGTGPQVAAGQ